MKVIDVCRLATTDSNIVVKDWSPSGKLRFYYDVPRLLEDADEDIMSMEVKYIDIEEWRLILNVGDTNFM